MFSFAVALPQRARGVLPSSSLVAREQLRPSTSRVRRQFCEEPRPAPSRFEVVAGGQQAYDSFDPFYVKEKEAATIVFNVTNYLTAKRLISELDEAEATAFRAFFNSHSLRRDPKEFAMDLLKEHPAFGFRFFALQEEIVECTDAELVRELLMENLEKTKIETLRKHLRESSLDNVEPTDEPEAEAGGDA